VPIWIVEEEVEGVTSDRIRKVFLSSACGKVLPRMVSFVL